MKTVSERIAKLEQEIAELRNRLMLAEVRLAGMGQTIVIREAAPYRDPLLPPYDVICSSPSSHD